MAGRPVHVDLCVVDLELPGMVAVGGNNEHNSPPAIGHVAQRARKITWLMAPPDGLIVLGIVVDLKLRPTAGRQAEYQRAFTSQHVRALPRCWHGITRRTTLTFSADFWRVMLRRGTTLVTEIGQGGKSAPKPLSYASFETGFAIRYVMSLCFRVIIARCAASPRLDIRRIGTVPCFPPHIIPTLTRLYFPLLME
jgi:hypothetical protein